MKSRWLAAVAAVSTVAAFAGSAIRPSGSSQALPKENITRSWGKVPLAFEPNVGQADPSVRFLSHTGRVTFALTPVETVLSLPSVTLGPSLGRLPKPASPGVLGMTFIGADPSVEVEGTDPLPGVSNYFIGNDPRQWHTGVPHYARVVYRELYPGIDLTFYGNQSGHLEYDFTVRPGADPSVIALGMRGTSGVKLTASGDLVIRLGDQTLTQLKPRVYQVANGVSQPVSGGYALEGDQVSFAVGSFDRSRPLVIDPEVAYSTYLGGSSGADLGEEFPAADDSGHVYVCGATDSTDFPVTHGVYQDLNAGGGDAFITEMNADGTGLVFSTYLGGTVGDDAVSCVLDSHGNLYAGGITFSSDFPTTAGAFQPSSPGGGLDGFVAKLSPNGSKLVYSTYVGGSSGDLLDSIKVDGRGYVFAAGATCSPDFPTTPGAFQPHNAGGSAAICTDPPLPADYFVLKLNPAGSAPAYSTYLGGPGDDCCQPGIAIDRRGAAYVVGPTSSRHFPTRRGAFQRRFKGGPNDFAVSKLNPTGSRLLYSTYLGGSGDDGFDDHIAVDAAGNAYTGGSTDSTDFPMTPGAFQTQYAGGVDDGFITKLNPTGSALVFSTYLGGSGDEGAAPVIDGRGHVYTALITTSLDFPVTEDAFQGTHQGGTWDGTITELTSDGSGLIFSTYWGGSGDDGVNGIVLDGGGTLYATGCTQSIDFPTTKDAFQTILQGGTATDIPPFVCGTLPQDAFVTKIKFDQNMDQARPVLRGPAGQAGAGVGESRPWGFLVDP